MLRIFVHLACGRAAGLVAGVFVVRVPFPVSISGIFRVISYFHFHPFLDPHFLFLDDFDPHFLFPNNPRTTLTTNHAGCYCLTNMAASPSRLRWSRLKKDGTPLGRLFDAGRHMSGDHCPPQHDTRKATQRTDAAWTPR